MAQTTVYQGPAHLTSADPHKNATKQHHRGHHPFWLFLFPKHRMLPDFLRQRLVQPLPPNLTETATSSNLTSQSLQQARPGLITRLAKAASLLVFRFLKDRTLANFQILVQGRLQHPTLHESLRQATSSKTRTLGQIMLEIPYHLRQKIYTRPTTSLQLIIHTLIFRYPRKIQKLIRRKHQ